MCINRNSCKIVLVGFKNEQRQNSKEDFEHKIKRKHPRRRKLRTSWE
jgi:uncharacterized Rossmann fold enzyme